MLRQVAAEGGKPRPRIRHINARFYYATIFNCSLNDAPDLFRNIVPVIPDSLFFIIVARQIFDFFYLDICAVNPCFGKYLRNLFTDTCLRKRLTLVSSLIRAVTA